MLLTALVAKTGESIRGDTSEGEPNDPGFRFNLGGGLFGETEDADTGITRPDENIQDREENKANAQSQRLATYRRHQTEDVPGRA